MPLPDDTHCALNEKDLPAEIFDEKWKTDIKFLEFSNPVILNEKIDDMRKWIEHFDSKIFSTYYANTFDNIKHIQDKRCRDLNYYINYVLYNIPKITKNTQNTADIIETFQRFINAIFISWGNVGSLAKFKCTRVHKDYTDKMDLIKQLDDYCENKKSFQEKLQKYDYITCCKYATYVRYKKRSFHDYILRGYITKNDDDFHIEDNCKISESESDELPVASLNGHLATSQQHMLRGTLPEDSFNSNHISNEDTYDDVNGMFSEGTSHYLDTLQENNRFHIAYDPINN
ncbi:PIR Superfamily Protein [Plasmodium ovale curtisi]|uniref:PIR Superfamily Protein n=2 Tax=Plasmodium ovale curtisi TaxID=864141 RepID=A0A1A8WM29_PLAOA|nr:PIR Superfamily Protein [Plasmodium ovale curtisi]